MEDSAWMDWYRAQHDARCRYSGEAFEAYVESVLKRFHTDYLNPDPMGSRGDGGCDGIADNGSVLYACYGQRAASEIDRKTKDKLESDFIKALENWDEFTTWRFVTNAGFGKDSTKTLIDLRNLHAPGTARPVTLEVWNPDDLWFKAVKELSKEQLDEIMPGVPHSQNVELADLVDLIESLEQVPDDGEQLEHINPVPATKMEFNKLSELTRIEFNAGRVLSPRIDRWFAAQADPGLRDEKAASFRKIYRNTKQATHEPSEIVERVYTALGGQDVRMSTKRANAVYAVTVYFFDTCDIFEEPPAGYMEGGENNAIAD